MPKSVIVGITVATVTAAAAAVSAVRWPVDAPVAPSVPAAAGVGPALPAPPPPAPVPMAPGFDAVRVGSAGLLIAAGRAPPGAEVALQDGDRTLGRITADPSGQWLFLAQEPLPPGPHQLGLVARTPTGAAVESEHVVILAIPAPHQDIAGRMTLGDAERERPLALLVPRDRLGPSVVLQAPLAAGMAPAPGQGSAATAEADRGPGRPVIAVIDHDEEGRVIVTGSAAARAPLRLSQEGAVWGETTADSAGRYRLEVNHPVPPGHYRLRIDQLTPDGGVAASAEAPFVRMIGPPEPAAAAAGGRIVVRPGDSLWQIARSSYGSGELYTAIYTANRSLISDPDLIFPGQVFTLPVRAAAARAREPD